MNCSHRRRISLLSILAVMACLPVTALADIDFQYTTLNYPTMQNTLAYQINDSGEIAGYYWDPTNTGGADRGFTYTPSSACPPESGCWNTEFAGSSSGTDLYGLNNAGALVGTYFDQGFTNVNGLLIAGGSPQLPGPDQTEYYGINNNGAIVGSNNINAAAPGGFFLTGSTSSPVVYPNATGTFPHAVNDSNAIVGFYQSSGGPYLGFLTTPGCQSASCFTSIGPAGSYSSFAYGINDSGLIVGASEAVAGGPYQGFLFDGNTYTVLDVPGAVSTFAAGINSEDQIVGWYTDANGYDHAFDASPVPEPAMSGMLAAVMLLIAGLRIRSKSPSAPPTA